MTQIRMRAREQVVSATVVDNPTAADFVSLLPVTVQMHDLFGREKPGQLPRALAPGGPTQYTYEVGDISYWAPSRDIAIFYAQDGQRIPNPGLVPLARIDNGLEAIAQAGDDFTITIELIP